MGGEGEYNVREYNLAYSYLPLITSYYTAGNHSEAIFESKAFVQNL